ncbi:saccharopine dehydrogenase family protein [Pseudonocardia sp. TRM90224]|uniref:saccharopine dehydrogenase family protein n=1 Tax=Pseudonocardia sp. TRM90224 TaxID=2812678 RepID=UPI001E597506|nr:saccharopine dehydrogenase NADP-binding domain-containing protein [Pseudonocardia sp. TRM90224]
MHALPHRVVVYGAYGHTGRFVTAELLRRGLEPILSGRDPEKLASFAAAHPALEVRAASVDDPESLMKALAGASVVINCAGPFLDTAGPLATAAVRSGVHYLDVSAEQAAVQERYRDHGETARAAGVAVVPAMAFYGGLADLMATAAVAGWTSIDEITVAVALDRWWPTEGTRRTGARNTAPRLAVAGGRLAPITTPPQVREWRFPEPFGEQQTVELPFSEIVSMAAHLPVSTIRSFFATGPLQDLRDPSTPAPEAVDGTGRSAQRFVVDVVATSGGQERGFTVSGQDIYAASAPIVVEAAVRLLTGRSTTVGVAAPGELFDAADMLDALSPDPLTIVRR